MRHRVYVELKWLKFFVENVHPRVALTAEQLNDLQQLHDVKDADLIEIFKIEAKTNHDVKAVEYYLRERIQQTPSLSFCSEFVHALCTSEDINSLAYAFMLKECLTKIILPSIRSLLLRLQTLATQHAEAPLLARTHGQPASPTTFGKEFAVYYHRLQQQMRKLEEVKPAAKFSGAVGNFNAHAVAFPGLDWPKLAQQFVEGLGVCYQPFSTQIECHDWISSLCDELSRFNTILLGLCQDCWAYISRDLLALQLVAGEVGSSTMPHKINPIDFENAEGNLGIACAMLRFFRGRESQPQGYEQLKQLTRGSGSVSSKDMQAFIFQTPLSKELGDLFIEYD
ncbi:adenylosuccinate lyase, putative [Eimeria acervulina]|uniref:Adenylosuccinate lyase, putative n=1 Tax=Eimeria acervulina TaxID=5801 RepID=U6GVI1_EIMAC|nr:adenylosuccinate lyase, putative [Eimeria acervulina]CDI83577.1 adenylosuccinate lyase, putative [Eimeria acervulina]